MTKEANILRSVPFLAAALSLAASSLVVAAITLGAPSGCSQPATLCAMDPGEGIARYTFVSQQGSCTGSALPSPSSMTNTNPGSFPIGVEGYPVSPVDPNGPNTPASMALQPEWLGARIEDAQLNAAADFDGGVQAAMANYPYASAAAVPSPPPQGTGANHPYAWGVFESVTPDSSGICRLPPMTSGPLTYPDIPAHTANQTISSPLDPGIPAEDGGPGVAEYVLAGESVPDQPATTVTYAWSNVRVYVSAAEDGAQTYADLTATQDGCTMTYHVSILVPRVLCGTTDDGGATIADPTLCNPLPNSVNPNGSGINALISPSCENIGTTANPDYECLPPAQDPLEQLQ